MQLKERVLQTLQVRESEWWLVRQLFFQQFFSGAGIALFFTAAFTMFLEKFSITELPKTLIASSFMLWLTGIVFTKVEHLFPLKKLILILNLFIVLSILAFRFACGVTDNLWFHFSMLVWYNVLYLLSSLDFWGLAALLFDIRQSKRLFGIISAGDIPAKFIGYSVASIIIPIIGPANLLYIGAGSVLYSLVYWHRLKKSGHLDLHVEHHSHVHRADDQTKIGSIINNFFQNNLVLHLAILAFLITSTFTIINFAFYAEVKHSFGNGTKLGSYIAICLAFSRGIAIVMKLFFTNRITNALGIKRSLLITPVILSLLFIPIFITPLFSTEIKWVLIIFGLLSITNDVLRSSIQTPVFLSVMQPLRANVRLRAHNIVKGVMDPFAFFFCGILLWLMLRIEDKVDMLFLCYILSALLIISIIWVYIVDREYVQMLVIALRNRYFNGKDVNLQDKGTLDFFAKKIESGSESEVIIVLNLIKDSETNQAENIIRKALNYTSDTVKLEAVKTAERLKMKTLLDDLKSISKVTENQKLLCETVKAIYAMSDDVDDLNTYLNQNNLELTSAAIIGMMRNDKTRKYAQEHLQQLLQSTNIENKIYASNIIAETKDNEFADELIKLLNDADDKVKIAAIESAGKMHNAAITLALLELFKKGIHEKKIMLSFIEAGEISLNILAEHLKLRDFDFQKQNKLISVIGKSTNSHAKKILDDLINHFDESSIEIIQALYQSGFKVDHSNHKKYSDLINFYLKEAAQIVMHIQTLQSSGNHNLLIQALQLELHRYRSVVLNLFTFIYDTEKIQRARNAFNINKKESVANALEIIDVTISKEFAHKFIAIYDDTEINTKTVSIKKFFTINAVSFDILLKEILNPVNTTFTDWTKACALFELKNGESKKYNFIITQLSKSDNLIVKQTAEYVLSN